MHFHWGFHLLCFMNWSKDNVGEQFVLIEVKSIDIFLKNNIKSPKYDRIKIM